MLMPLPFAATAAAAIGHPNNAAYSAAAATVSAYPRAVRVAALTGVLCAHNLSEPWPEPEPESEPEPPQLIAACPANPTTLPTGAQQRR